MITNEALQRRLDTRTKPQGSLGALETLAMRIGLALDTDTPVLRAPQMFVFAGDHGIATDGVSAFPQAVTAQMLLNYLQGGAAINVLARQHGMTLNVVDAGVATDIGEHPSLLARAVGRSTRNFRIEPAMTPEQCARALDTGKTLAKDALRQGSNALMFGEMGIGNTASASMLLHRRTGWTLEECVGRGTGLDDVGLARKRERLAAASARCPRKLAPIETIAEFGGFELAMITGALLATADEKCIAVIDGFAVSVSAMLAIEIDPRVRSRCIFSHCSAEHAHRQLLAHLDVKPLLDLGMRLGEGTGAAMAWPIIDAAARLMTEMASFESAGVDDRAS
ncbi:nicotinate-nucleotide--dimethylbenzimidazole phosphoribosyltransferase [Steroidobacter sp. S1-65]|uniref:Nicotinate-nucleotide--dimethylbenzimidazole phosphoribosyltransferase n=1 Tax=Steroidobacter gossypii TaxID=2805490 RepID=A0ABS1X2S2_9GAMM|nr:nicotinate-nucleotide--dimethylbenzimidazole phosphoribosyltransferase [Steroidobacter gossypii]MBM0107522.1 nicotinate-nucleotide--dimethylbenzimidazole phosphoribosyltransferase [Steroidobacter gossypii]